MILQHKFAISRQHTARLPYGKQNKGWDFSRPPTYEGGESQQRKRF